MQWDSVHQHTCACLLGDAGRKEMLSWKIILNQNFNLIVKSFYKNRYPKPYFLVLDSDGRDEFSNRYM